MILGFAHITKNVPRCEATSDHNPAEKWPLMAQRPLIQRLSLAINKFGFQEESIEYHDTGLVEGASRLAVSFGGVRIRSQNPWEEAMFLCYGIGFKPCAVSELELPSVAGQWRIRVGIEEWANAPIDPPLDIAGYAAIAFYSTDVEADRDLLLKHGGRTPTQPFGVKVGERNFRIVMLRSPEGTIIELIQVVT